MRPKALLALAVAGAMSPWFLDGQVTPAAVPATAPAVEQAQGDAAAIRLRALQAVLDARERREDWHIAAQQAIEPVQVEALKAQLTQRLSGLAPRIAKALVSHPQEDALVDVAVYKKPGGDGSQAMVAVTFEGLGNDIGGDYFGSVLAGEIRPPQLDEIPQRLVLDPVASSYLVFFLGKTGLMAGDIPQTKMKQSILAAVQHQRDVATHQDQVALERQLSQQHQAVVAQQEQAADAAQQAAAQQPVIPIYPNGDPNSANYNDGYYYPGVGVPIVILSDGFSNTPEWQARERRREERLERAYRDRHTAQQGPGTTNGQSLPDPAGNQTPPGQAGIPIPPGDAGIRIPSGQAGLRTPPGDTGVRTGAGQRPAPPPAARETPAGREAPPPARQAPAAHEAPPAPAPSAPPAPPAPARR